MLEMIYVAMLIAWILLIMGFYFKDFWISAFASMFLIIVGLYIVLEGLPSEVNSWFTLGIAVIHICIGGYVLVRGGIEEIGDF